MIRGCAARRWIHAALTLAGITLMVAMAAVRHDATAQEPEGPDPAASTTPGAAPGEQPIAFSHARHVGQVGLDCQFCHAYARRGPVAGIPAVERCVGCHRNILTERPEIVKVLDYWEQQAPIPWLRVHDLPDYVRFSHKAHVRGGIDCAACHGDVARMDVAVQVESLSMGWCVDCHTSRNASRDCLVCHY